METVRFTADRAVKHGDNINMQPGDSLTVPVELATYFCGQGWGSADGIESAAFKPGHVELAPQNVSQQLGQG